MRGSLPLSRSHLPPIVIPAKAGIQLYCSKLDPDFRQGDEYKNSLIFPSPLCGRRWRDAFSIEPDEGVPPHRTPAHVPPIVIPAKAGIQLYCSKLDPDFRQGDEETDKRKTF